MYSVHDEYTHHLGLLTLCDGPVRVLVLLSRVLGCVDIVCIIFLCDSHASQMLFKISTAF